jgi:hypothetical protein
MVVGFGYCMGMGWVGQIVGLVVGKEGGSLDSRMGLVHNVAAGHVGLWRIVAAPIVEVGINGDVFQV